MKYTVTTLPDGSHSIQQANEKENHQRLKEYEVNIYHKPKDECISVVIHDEDQDYYQVMRIGKPSASTEHYMINSEDYIVDITWCKDGYSLISLVFKMFLSVNRYHELISGDRDDVDKKILRFYLNAVKTLTDLQNSFPL